jgi:large subunit ribosomal protein L10
MTLKKEVKSWKKREVDELAEQIKKYKVIAVANLHKVRATQVQELRKKFRSEIVFKSAKNTLIKRAIEKCSKTKPKIEELGKHLVGSSLFIFTNMNPFKLSLLLGKSKMKMAAKAGDVAQTDIIIPEGNTGMVPGPIISELTEVGLPTKIESGSVWITDDTVVVKRGETISAKLASVLSKLGIKPIEVGLSLNAAYEDGLIYTADVLNIDAQAYRQDLQNASAYAYNLTVNAGYLTPEALPMLLSKAVTEARSLASAASVFEKDTLGLVLAKHYSQMSILLSRLAEKQPSIAQ